MTRLKKKPAMLVMEITAVGKKIKLDFPNGTDRLTQHGFGLFLENFKNDEVYISSNANKLLLSCPSRGGICPMEFWGDHIGFIAREAKISEISVYPEFKNRLRILR